MSTASAPKLLFLEYEPYRRNPLDNSSLPTGSKLRVVQSIANYFHVRLIVTDNLQPGAVPAAGTTGQAYDLVNPIKEPVPGSQIKTQALKYDFEDKYKTWDYKCVGKTTAGLTHDMIKKRAEELIAKYNIRGFHAILRNCQTFASELAEACIDTAAKAEEPSWQKEYLKFTYTEIG
ncbi:hypothetical protein V5O48_009447, partial [Marasmius crinis-equi]